MILPFNYSVAQTGQPSVAPIQAGSSVFQGDIYHDGGNVGIGTDSPDALLHIEDDYRPTTPPTIPNITPLKIVGFDGVNTFTAMKVTVTGNVGIGTDTPLFPLDVYGNTNITGELTIKAPSGVTPLGNGTKQIVLRGDGLIEAREIEVDYDIIPDYVFYDDYDLMPLDDLEKYIDKNKHLPNIKSASEYDKTGSIALGELNTKLLEKVEELTLYLLQQNEKIKQLENEIQLLKSSSDE